jgi:hypothetical protein
MARQVCDQNHLSVLEMRVDHFGIFSATDVKITLRIDKMKLGPSWDGIDFFELYFPKRQEGSAGCRCWPDLDSTHTVHCSSELH